MNFNYVMFVCIPYVYFPYIVGSQAQNVNVRPYDPNKHKIFILSL